MKELTHKIRLTLSLFCMVAMILSVASSPVGCDGGYIDVPTVTPKPLATPDTPTLTALDNGIIISWTPVTGATLYKVEYQTGESTAWTELTTTASTTMTYYPNGKLVCGTIFRFRVFAAGDGRVYFLYSGESSPEAAHTTQPCE